MKTRTTLGAISSVLPLTYTFYFCSALFPFVFDSSQLVLGTLTNGILIIAAYTERDFRKIIPLVFLPSLATLAKGLLFGPFTPLLLYMIPFIWAGNALFVSIVRMDRLNLPLIGRIILGASGKALLLFGIANGFIALGILPKIFATSMGLVQLITALLGGLGAAGIVLSIQSKNSGDRHV